MLRRSRTWSAVRLLRERKADRAKLARGPEEWVDWWRARGQSELRCILMTAWDPIGVGDEPDAWDEYDDYVFGVARRLREAPDHHQGAENVRAYLSRVERDLMELVPTPESERETSKVADCLAAWHAWSYEQGGRPTTLDDLPD